MPQTTCLCGKRAPTLGLPGEGRSSARWCSACPFKHDTAVDMINKRPHCPSRRIALMTGAIQGIGTETAQQLDGEGGLTAVRGCRSEELSAAAAAELSAAGCDVLFRRLHLTDGASISAMADFLVGAHGGQLDMLVNNAAVCFNDPTLFKGRVPHTPVTAFQTANMIWVSNEVELRCSGREKPLLALHALDPEHFGKSLYEVVKARILKAARAIQSLSPPSKAADVGIADFKPAVPQLRPSLSGTRSAGGSLRNQACGVSEQHSEPPDKPNVGTTRPLNQLSGSSLPSARSTRTASLLRVGHCVPPSPEGATVTRCNAAQSRHLYKRRFCSADVHPQTEGL
eukprot:jgi/Tetstr1/450225/TSEL_037263.t1